MSEKKAGGKSEFSQATVSRVLRHCGNVDTDTRRRILFSEERFESEPDQACDVYVILPGTPRFFWEKLKHGMSRTEISKKIRVKYNVYSGIRDADVVMYYLSEAERLSPKVIVIATILSDEIREKLAELQKHCMIVFLSEYSDFVNAFFFGADNMTDGRRMGEAFLSRFSDRVPIVLHVDHNPNVNRRTEGFLDALVQSGEERFRHVQTLSIPPSLAVDIKLFPSKLASLLAERMDASSKYCVYVPFGNIYLSRVRQKMKCGDRLIFLAHDSYIGTDGYPAGGVALAMNQDTFAQGRAAILAIEQYFATGVYPKSKCNYVPSLMVEGRSESAGQENLIFEN